MAVAHRRGQLAALGPAEVELADQDVETAGAQGAGEVGGVLDLVEAGLRQVTQEHGGRKRAILRVLVNQKDPWSGVQGTALPSVRPHRHRDRSHRRLRRLGVGCRVRQPPSGDRH